MNRHERRVAKARARHARNNDTSRITAVHEAGHAVAKVLAAGELGYSIDEAIDHIEMGMEESRLQSLGVTFGPVFSQEISKASNEFLSPDREINMEGREALEFGCKVIERGRATGADIGKWFRARVFDAVSGPLAEAIFSERNFYDVWRRYEAEGDRNSVMRNAHWAAIETEEMTSMIKRMAVLSAILMENPPTWAAVLALANKLPAFGKMAGSKAVSIITSAIPEAELTGMFAAALERMWQLEQEVAAHEVVFAALSDGSHLVIKGAKLLEKYQADGERLFAALPECTFRVFGETLHFAFGDGALT